MKPWLFFVLVCLHLSCAKVRTKDSPPRDDSKSNDLAYPPSTIPSDIKKFCNAQCLEDVNGIPMFVRECYDECVKDLMEKQGTWKRLWRSGVSRSGK